MNVFFKIINTLLKQDGCRIVNALCPAWCFLVILGSFTNVSAQEVPNGAVQAGPVAVTPESEYRFADIVEGQTITHDFSVFNKGTSELLIEKVESG